MNLVGQSAHIVPSGVGRFIPKMDHLESTNLLAWVGDVSLQEMEMTPSLAQRLFTEMAG